MEKMADQIIYRASELGGCIKALVAKRIGFVPAEWPDDMKRRAEEGNIHEAAVLTTLDIGRRQTEVVIPITERVTLTGHLDGVDESLMRVVEVKTMGDASFKTFTKTLWDTDDFLITRYKWQLSCYMIAMGMPAIVYVKNRNDGEVLALDVAEPFHGLGAIRARVLQVEALARGGNLPLECSVNQYPCPFYYLHDEVEKEIAKDVDEVVFDSLMVSYFEGDVMEKRGKAIKDEAREMIVKVTGGQDYQSMKGYKATAVTTTRTKFDKAKAQKDGVNISQYEETNTTESMRFDQGSVK